MERDHWEKIEEYYNKDNEHKRVIGDGNLERLRTLDILDRYIKSTHEVIYDVGGGAGVYAFPLANKGFQVHLIDPMDIHIERVSSQNFEVSNKLASIKKGNALDLPYENASGDVVLFFGPLYHLTEEKERLQALHEAKRVLKKGGLFLGVGVSHFASLIDLFNDSNYLEHKEIQLMIEEEINSGQHRCPQGFDCWTTAFMHHPNELINEIVQAGFHSVELLGIEGPVWNDVSDRLIDEKERKARLDLLRKVEKEPSLIGASAHMMAIGVK